MYQPDSLQAFYTLIGKDGLHKYNISVILISKEREDYESVMAKYGSLVFDEVKHCKMMTSLIQKRLDLNRIDDENQRHI